MESQDTIFEKLKQSKVFKVLSGYAIAAFVTVQVASLVSDSFGFGDEFMQNIIIIFLVILPFIALVAWASSSRYGTFKILGISFFLLFTGVRFEISRAERVRGTGKRVRESVQQRPLPAEGKTHANAAVSVRRRPGRPPRSGVRVR